MLTFTQFEGSLPGGVDPGKERFVTYSTSPVQAQVFTQQNSKTQFILLPPDRAKEESKVNTVAYKKFSDGWTYFRGKLKGFPQTYTYVAAWKLMMS